jgi:DNA-binding transcriptional LysR family regulator
VQGDDRWQFTDADGQRTSAAVQGPLRSNNLSAVLEAARAGHGLAALPWYVARESVADGSIRPVLERHALPVQELHAVFPSPKLVPSKVAAFIGFLQQSLGRALVDGRRSREIVAVVYPRHPIARCGGAG